MSEPRYKIVIGLGDDVTNDMLDCYAFLITPQETGSLPIAVSQYTHLAEVFDKLGTWFRAMRVIYTLTHLTRGVSKDWTP